MHLTRVVVIVGLVLACTSCKIEITTSSGQVRSDSGAYICKANETCVIDVVDTFFNETFTAIPRQGFTFTAWRTRPDALCGGSDTPCRLTTEGVDGTPLSDILESDQKFFLEPVFGRQNNWRPRANVAISGVSAASCVINGKIYAIGLGWGESGAGLGHVEVYDPVADNWTSRASLPTPRAIVATGVVGNRCYAIGGGNGGGGSGPGVPALTAVDEYDPQTDTWRPRAPLPVPRAIGGGAVVGGKIYVIGGSDGVSWTVTPLATVAIYDPKANTWTSGANMPTPRIGLGVAAVDGLIYAIGGSNHDLDIFSSRIVERYDPAKDKWTRVADLPEDRDFLTAVALNGKLYAVGGLINPSDRFMPGAVSSTSVYRYDPATDRWARIEDMSVARYGAAVAALDGQVYVVSGRTSRESDSVDSTEEYTP